MITPAKLTELKAAVTSFAQALTQGSNSWSSEQAIARQLAHYKLTGDRIVAAYTIAVGRP